MNIEEYNLVKKYNYLQYCEYLKNKYGIPVADYFTKNWNKIRRISRTKDGLFLHHVFEDHAIMLSTPIFAKMNPIEWQKAENLVYCDYLEHLLLHILICENPSDEQNAKQAVGIGGAINFIIPELNDVYSGFVSGMPWKQNCFEKIINDKEVYLLLVKRLKNNCKNYPTYDEKNIYRSYNQNYHKWDDNNNIELYEQLKKL